MALFLALSPINSVIYTINEQKAEIKQWLK